MSEPAKDKEEFHSRTIERLCLLSKIAEMRLTDQEYQCIEEKIPKLFTRDEVDRILNEAIVDWKDIVDN